jgi:predicted permease
VLVNPWVDEFILAETGGKRGSWTRIELLPGSRGLDGLRRRYSKPLWILMAIAALVLLISCGNVANLLLARAVNRQREMAVRLSIGASRKRLLRQLLTESFLFSLLGGAASLVLAVWCARLLIVLMSDPLNPLVLPVSVDVRILTFTGLVSLLTSLLFGVLPALRATRMDLSPPLKSQRAMTQSGSAGRLKGLLVTAQVALSLLLLIGAGLFVRSLSNIRGLDPGFNPDRLLLVEFNPHGLGLRGEQLRTRLHSFCEQVLQRFESVPGVQSVSLSTLTPMSGDETTRWFTTGNFTPRQMNDSVVRVNVVSPEYFATLGVPVAFGRAFNSSDRAGAPRVGILNEAAARFYFAGASPVGKTFRLGRENASPAIEIIGVVGDTKQRDPREPTVRSVFLPFDQSPGAIGSIQVRSMGEASSLIPALRAAARSVSADVPISSIRTVREQVDANLSRERMIATLSTSFGALALFLAAVGLYGVIRYSVSTRTGEIGIRMALGADTGGVLGLVGREAARLVCAGVTVGLVAAFAFTRFIEGSMLFGLTPTDGATFAVATLTLAAIAGLAVLISALRAARIDPTVALRHE